MRSSIALATLAAATAVTAYSVPSNLAAIYKNHKAGSCSKKLVGGFDDGSTAYCGDLSGAIFLHRTKNGGEYADMDIDCDGANNHAGACKNDPSGQDITAFQDEVSTYGIKDLDANLHPYVVFGNEGDSPSFNPKNYGMEPLSVMAVVCNNQLFYGIWGDTNGGTLTGEASVALGKLCFPNEGLNGNNGHEGHDVLYIGFTGSKAKPGKSGAKWTASSTSEFQASIKSLGDSLVAKLSG